MLQVRCCQEGGADELARNKPAYNAYPRQLRRFTHMQHVPPVQIRHARRHIQEEGQHLTLQQQQSST
jgi:hypothetical protein